MSTTHNRTEARIAAIHWATEDLIERMAQEVMGDEGFKVFQRFVEAREAVRRETYGDETERLMSTSVPTVDSDVAQ